MPSSRVVAASGSASPQSLTESWEFKMCKKIAQLTKVVYTLNCRNEDSEERTKWLVQCHEDEIRRLQQECSKQIEAAAARIKQAENNKIQTMRTIEVNYESAVNEARDAFTEKLQQITGAAEAAKESYERKLKKVQEEHSTTLQGELSMLRETKDLELANLVKEYNDRYKSMLVDQMDIRDTMEKQLRAEWQEQVKAMERELASVKSTSSAQLNAKSERLQDEVRKTKALEKELNGAKEQLSQQEANRRELESANEQLQRQLNKTFENLNSTKGNEEGLQKQLERIAKEKSEMSQEFEKVRQSLKEAQRNVEKLSSDCVNANNHLEVAMAQKSTAEEELKELRKQHEKLRSMAEELEKQRASLSHSMQNKDSGIAQLELSLEKTKAEVDLLRSQSAETMRALNKAHEEALRRAEQCSQESATSVLERCRKEMEDMKAKFSKQLQEGEEAQRSRIALLNQKNDERYGNLQNRLVKLQEEKDALQEQQSTLQQERDAIQSKFDVLEVEHRRHREEASEQHIKDDTEIARLRDVIASLTEQGATELDAVHQALSEQVAQFSLERETLMRRFEEEKLHIQENSRQLLQEAEERYHAHVAVLKDRQEAAERQLSSSTQENEKELQKLRLAASQAQECFRAETEAIQSRFSEKLKSLEMELERLRSAGEQDQSHAREELQRLEETIAGLRAESAQREAAHTAALQSLREAAEAERAAADREHAAELTKARQNHAKEVEKLNEAMTNAAAEQSRQVALLEQVAMERAQREEQAWCARFEALQEKAALERREQEAYHATELATQLEELRCIKDDTISECHQELLRITEKMESTVREVGLLQGKLQVAEKGLSDAAAHMQKDRREAAEALDQVRNEHLEAMRRVEEEHNSHLNLLAAEYKRLSDNSLLQLEGERRSHQMVVAQMQANYEELQHKYYYRESRPEDVDLINQLTQSNHEKDKALNKAHHDLQVYKLELINREENYNKIFARNPVLAADTTTQRTATSLPSIKQTHRGVSKQA